MKQGRKANTKVYYHTSHCCEQLGFGLAGMGLRTVHPQAQVPHWPRGAHRVFVNFLGLQAAAEPK